MNILKKDCLAYYDSAFSGLVPVKVLNIEKVETNLLFDIGFGGDMRMSTKVIVEVTEDTPTYKKGEVLHSNAAFIVPRTAIHGNMIQPYNVEV